MRPFEPSLAGGEESIHELPGGMESQAERTARTEAVKSTVSCVFGKE